MAIFKSFNDIVVGMLDYLRLVQSNLDTKPGTVARDLFVDTPAAQISELYSQLRNISNMQSFFAVSGVELNRLASNFGLSRRSGTSSTGVAVLTTNNLDSDILIPAGAIVIANNGISFQVVNNAVMSSSSSNVYKATALRLNEELNLASITDQFAIEVTVEALTSGTSGNIGLYSLTAHDIPGISRITNLKSFSGGSNPEGDDAFRTRILSVFAGSNTGTSLGYSTAVEAVDGVQDAIVVTPGDPLLIRDGTQTAVDANGNLVVSDPGTGGKVDIYVLGTELQSQLDSFIYNDQSGRNDPTNTVNDVVLGQRGENFDKDISQRRVELIASGELPYQPVSSIVSVVGSSSGSNFQEKYTDSSGAVKGNYELIKDSGDYGGSSFGFDKLRWISNYVELDEEEIIKGAFCGNDGLDFNDVESIRSITQDVSVVNENSEISASDRSIITLKHKPVRRVNRVSNLTIGERYVIENQNLDGASGSLNTTGRIKISGNTLPVGTDVLQIDYSWVKSFDRDFDFDNLSSINEFRSAQDSVDWSFGNLVRREPAVAVDVIGSIEVAVDNEIFKVVSVDAYAEQSATVSGTAISLSQNISNIIDVRRVSDGAELFNTDVSDGIISGAASFILPSDTIAEDGDIVVVRFNSVNLFNPDGGNESSFTGSTITLPDGAISSGSPVLVTYVANILELIPAINLADLPAIGSDNEFLVENVATGVQPTTNIKDGLGNVSYNLKTSPSNIRIYVDGIQSNGSIGLLGTTSRKVVSALIPATSGSGLVIDLSQAIADDFGAEMEDGMFVSSVISIEAVTVDANGLVSSVDNEFEIANYKLLNNTYDLAHALLDVNLSAAQIELQGTPNNVDNLISTGDMLRVTFYYAIPDDSELLYFSKNGELISDKKFMSFDKIFINSGFKNLVGETIGTIVCRGFNQPRENTVFSVDYDYVSPKENERITITFNTNVTINNAMFALESVRPITADVLVKQAREKKIDFSAKIILLPEYATQEQTVIQNAIDAVTSMLSSTSLGTVIDSSDITSRLYSVSGIDRVRIINFSYDDSGNVLSISANKNEYLAPNSVDIQVEDR